MNTMEWIKEHSTLVLLLVGGLLVGILFLKKTPQTAVAPGAGADLSGLATDASGHPIVYRAVSDTFITENVSGSYNSAAQDATQSVNTAVNSPPTTTTTTTTDNHSAPIEHPIEPVHQTAFIRARYSAPAAKPYDDKWPQGVPLRKSPGGAQIGFIPYGSSIAVTGSGVSGGTNFFNSNVANQGSTMWIPVTGGFVSAFDVTSIQ